MPTPPNQPPPEAYRWKKGQSGNPAGYSKKRRLADALTSIIDRKGLSEELAMVAIALASGRKELLAYKDPKTGTSKVREPDLAWFNVLRSMLAEVEVDRREDSPITSTLNPDLAAKLLKVMAESIETDDEGPAE